MPLIPVLNKWGEVRRERLVLFGGPKVGKSDAVLKLANWYRQTDTPGTFYYMDTDCQLNSITENSQYDVSNIRPMPIMDWDSCRKVGAEVYKSAGEGDWIVLDMAHRPNDWVNQWYIETKWGDEFEEKLMEMKWDGVARFGDNPLLEPADYKFINASYDRFFLPLAMKSKAHIICITEKAGVYKGKGADNEKIRMYDKVGGKPAGHKSLDYQLSTILHMDKTSFGRYLTTCGDRSEREMMDNSEYVDLVRSYLVTIGGWSIR